jgi:hypothetical protein
MKVARHFSAGKCKEKAPRPIGTREPIFRAKIFETVAPLQNAETAAKIFEAVAPRRVVP